MPSYEDHVDGVVAPTTIADDVATLKRQFGGNHVIANKILSNASNFASDPNAQEYVAAAANWAMDRNHQTIKFDGAIPQTNPNSAYKPNLVSALEALAKAGVLTEDNVHPELVRAISTFRNRYPNDRIPEAVQPIIQAIPKSSLVERLGDRLSMPRVSQV